MNRTRWFAAVLATAVSLAPTRVGYAGDDAAVATESAFLHAWSVTVTPDGSSLNAGRNAFKDMVLFEQDGYFTAEAFGPLGFGRSQYTLTALSETATGFSTTMSNGQQGTLAWNGVLEGGRIVGTLVWTKPDGSVGTYNFTASTAE